MSNASQPVQGRSWLSFVLNAIVCFAVLGASASAIVIINRTEPVTEPSPMMRAERPRAAPGERDRER